MAQPSLEELLSDVPREKLKLPCSDEDLCTLALSIPSWKELLPYLLPGQSDSTKNAIEEQYTSVERRRVAVLRKWRANRGKRATYEKLSEILWKRGWSHLVEKLCGLLVGHDTSSDSDEDSDDEALPREMLGLPCTMENLLELAPFVIDWKVVAPYLGLQDAHEKAIEEEHKGTEGRRVAMLKAWHHNIDKNGHQATYGMLCKALKKIGMLDLVEKLCDIYTASSVEQESSATEVRFFSHYHPDSDSSSSCPKPAQSGEPSTQIHLTKVNHCANKDIPPCVPLIAFETPDNFENVERLFHQLVLSGRSESINEKASMLVNSSEMDPSIKVLALGFHALEHIHGLNDPQSAMELLDKAMGVIRTEMDSNNAVTMKARILRHYTIAFRRQNYLELALDNVKRAKQLYETAQAPPYDYANLICEHAAILEMLHKTNMHPDIEQEIGTLWEIGASQIVRAKAYQFPTVVFVIRARQAMFHMKAWAGMPQSELVQPNPHQLRKAEECLQLCGEFKTSYQPSGYKVQFNIAYSYLRFWQGKSTEAIAHTKAAIRHYKDCQRVDEQVVARMKDRLQWLQSLTPDHPLQSKNDVLLQVLS